MPKHSKRNEVTEFKNLSVVKKTPKLESKKTQIDLLNNQIASEYNNIAQPIGVLFNRLLMPFILYPTIIYLQSAVTDGILKFYQYSQSVISPDELNMSSITVDPNTSHDLELKVLTNITQTFENGTKITETIFFPHPNKKDFPVFMTNAQESAVALCSELAPLNCSQETQNNLEVVDRTMNFYIEKTGMCPISEYIPEAILKSNGTLYSSLLAIYFNEFYKRLALQAARFKNDTHLSRFYQKDSVILTLWREIFSILRPLFNIFLRRDPTLHTSLAKIFNDTMARKALIDLLMPYNSLMHQNLKEFRDEINYSFYLGYLLLVLIQPLLIMLAQKFIFTPLLKKLNPIAKPLLVNTQIINTKEEADLALAELEKEKKRIEKFSFPIQMIQGVVFLVFAAYQVDKYFSKGEWSTHHTAYGLILAQAVCMRLVRTGVQICRDWKYGSPEEYDEYLRKQQLQYLNDILGVSNSDMTWSSEQGYGNSLDNAYFVLRVRHIPGCGIYRMHDILFDLFCQFGFNLLSTSDGTIAVEYNPRLTPKLVKEMSVVLANHIARAKLLNNLNKKLTSLSKNVSGLEIDIHYSKDDKQLPIILCRIECSAQKIELLQKILHDHNLVYSKDKDNYVEISLSTDLPGQFFSDLQANFALSKQNYLSSQVATEPRIPERLTAHHYYDDKGEDAKPSTVPLLPVSKEESDLPRDIDFGKYGHYFKDQETNDIKPLSGKRGNFVLFQPPNSKLTEKHFKNDTQALQDFKKLCEAPKMSRDQGDIGFKFDKRWKRDFLWQSGDGTKEKYVETSLKAKILGAQGKGKQRLFFRAVADKSNKFTLYIPCSYDPKHK